MEEDKNLLEEKLKESEALLETQFKNSPDLIMILDRNYRYLTLNRVLFGPYTVEGLIGKDAIEVLPPDVREMVRSKVNRCFTTGETQIFEHHMGEGEWVLARVVPLKSDHAVDRVMVISTDISERRKLEEELKKKLEDIEKLNKFLIERETRVMEVKDEVNGLLKELGRPPKYKAWQK